MAQLFHRELEVLGDLVHGGGKGVVVHVSDDVVDPAVLKQVFAAPRQIVLVVAVLIPLSLVRLYHELALRWVRVGHRQRIRDLPGKHLVLDVGGRHGRGLQQHHAVIVIILRVVAVI